MGKCCDFRALGNWSVELTVRFSLSLSLRTSRTTSCMRCAVHPCHGTVSLKQFGEFISKSSCALTTNIAAWSISWSFVVWKTFSSNALHSCLCNQKMASMEYRFPQIAPTGSFSCSLLLPFHAIHQKKCVSEPIRYHTSQITSSIATCPKI